MAAASAASKEDEETDTRVLVWGSPSYLQGVPPTLCIRADEVASVACGDSHGVLITASGRVFAFGGNEWSQLGLGNDSRTSRPVLVTALKDKRIVAAACGRNHTLFATDIGTLYAAGCNEEGQLGVELGPTEGNIARRPTPLTALPTHDGNVGASGQPLAGLACGAEHSAVLTSDGRLFTWGCGSSGQLGHGSTKGENTPRAVKVKSCKTPLTSVACGYYHTACIDSSGRLFTWGESEMGKLGLGAKIAAKGDDITSPRLVPGLPAAVSSVACGAGHSLVACIDGTVLACGDGGAGQLGLPSHSVPEMGLAEFTALPPLPPPPSSSPSSVAAIQSLSLVARIDCGESHSGLVTKDGRAFVFGANTFGMLGPAMAAEENEGSSSSGGGGGSGLELATQAPLEEGFLAEQLACGGWHTLVLTRWDDEEEFETEEEEEGEGEEEEQDQAVQGMVKEVGGKASAVSTGAVAEAHGAGVAGVSDSTDTATATATATEPSTGAAIPETPARVLSLTVASAAREKRRQDRTSALQQPVAMPAFPSDDMSSQTHLTNTHHNLGESTSGKAIAKPCDDTATAAAAAATAAGVDADSGTGPSSRSSSNNNNNDVTVTAAALKVKGVEDDNMTKNEGIGDNVWQQLHGTEVETAKGKKNGGKKKKKGKQPTAKPGGRPPSKTCTIL